MNRVWYGAPLAALLILAALVQADVTITSSVENSGLGGIANMQGTQKMLIAGDRSKTVSNMKMTNKVVKFFGGGKPAETAEITRLDKELMWAINPKEKSYTEMTFAQMKEMLQSARAKAASEKPAPDSARASAEIIVTPTGKTRTIAGYTANEVLMTMVFTGKDSSSGKTSKLNFEADMWISRDVPGYAEYLAYNKAMATKMGFTSADQSDMNNQLASFGIDAKVIGEKMKDVEGMPLMTIISILPEGMDSLMAGVNDSMEAASKRETAAEAAKDSSDDKTDASSIQSADDAKKSAVKKLGGLFGKKKDKNKEADEKAKQSKAQEKPYLFHVTTTVTEISQEKIPAGEFELPDGYKLKK